MTDIEFAARQADALRIIPVEFHAALSYMAYESGHAYGNDEIFNHLTDLIDGLHLPIKNYGDRRFFEGHGCGANSVCPAE